MEVIFERHEKRTKHEVFFVEKYWQKGMNKKFWRYGYNGHILKDMLITKPNLDKIIKRYGG